MLLLLSINWKKIAIFERTLQHFISNIVNTYKNLYMSNKNMVNNGKSPNLSLPDYTNIA
jgi:hypothetical protein